MDFKVNNNAAANQSKTSLSSNLAFFKALNNNKNKKILSILLIITLLIIFALYFTFQTLFTLFQ